MNEVSHGLRSRPPAQRAGLVLAVVVLLLAGVGLLARSGQETDPGSAPGGSSAPVRTSPDACGGEIPVADVDAPPVTAALGVTLLAGPQLQDVDASGGRPRTSRAVLGPRETVSSAVRTADGVYAIVASCTGTRTVVVSGSTIVDVSAIGWPILLVEDGTGPRRVTTAGLDQAVDAVDGSEPVPLPEGYGVAGAVDGRLVGRQQFVPAVNDSGNGAGKAPPGSSDDTPVVLVDPTSGAAVAELGTTSAPVVVAQPYVFWTGSGCLGRTGTCALSWWDVRSQGVTTRVCPAEVIGGYVAILALSPDGHSLVVESTDGGAADRTHLSVFDANTCSNLPVSGLHLTTRVPVAAAFDASGALLLIGVPVATGYDVLAWRDEWDSVRRVVTLSGPAAPVSPLLVAPG